MSEETGYIREELGAIKSGVEGLKYGFDEFKLEMREGLKDDRKRIRVIEDWRIKIMAVSAVIGIAVSAAWNFLF